MKRKPTAPDEILRAALEREKEARDFYAQLEVGCSVEFVKELLLKLQSEEAKHVHLIQRMLRRLESGSDMS